MRSFTPNQRYHSSACRLRRDGFTLVELMIVVGIMLLLAVMAAGAINLTIGGDKVRAGARQVQSYLGGARDRAIYAKAPRGVRFLVDPNNTRTVTSMVYIAPTDDWTQGTIELEIDGSKQVKLVRGFDGTATYAANNPTQWVSLYNQGLLRNGARILIPNDSTGTWYTITTQYVLNQSPKGPALYLTTPYINAATNQNASAFGDSAFTAGSGPQTYRLQLPPSVLPNQEPVLLPKGVVIDLDRCNKNPNSITAATSTLPQAWINTTVSPFIYSNQMDVMFSARGTVIGNAAGRGLIHFYLADQKDADNALAPENAPGDKVIASLFARTGAISTHPVDTIDTTTIGTSTVYDYFKYAETGEVAGK